MTGWSPPSVPRARLAGIGFLYLLLLGYALLVAQQVLLGVLLGFLTGFLYLLWRFLVAVEAIADALHRIARQRERG